MQVVDRVHVLPDGSTDSSGGRRVVLVRVEEDFTSGQHAGDLVEIETGFGGGDCGYPFREGERYIVDVKVQGGSLSTSTCSETRAEGEAGLLLRDLRRAARGEPSPDVSGIVTREVPNYVLERSLPKPVPDLAVVLKGLDGASYRTKTQADGVFEVARMSMGMYEVHYELPPEFTSLREGNAQSVAVPFTNGQGGSGCELNVAVYFAGKLSGQVVDAHGKGVEGSLFLSDRAPYSSQVGSSTAFGWSGADGRFSISPLEAGLYWIKFVPKGNMEAHWFYPGTRKLANATPVRIDEGKPTQGLVLELE